MDTIDNESPLMGIKDADSEGRIRLPEHAKRILFPWLTQPDPAIGKRVT
jgi:hypothetical protein